MPTVPLLSPDVAVSGQGTPEVNMAVPVEAFGGAVGHALSGLGDAVDRASDKIWSRAMEIQNLNNDTEAKKADTDYMIKAGELHAQFSSLEGNAAKDALPKYMQDQREARESIRSRLSNPMAQKMYDASSMSFMGRNLFNAAGHAAQQTKVAASNASTSRVETLTDTVGENPEDEQGFQRSVRAIRAETQSQGNLHGWSPEQTEQTSAANVSTAVAKRVAGLAKTDPFAAQTMFDSAVKSKALLPNDASRVQATIQTQQRQAIPRGISSEVNADLDHPASDGTPEKSLEDRIAEGQEKAKAYTKNDPLLADFVKQRIIADFNRSKGIQRDFDQRNEQLVAGALTTGNKEGILPKSIDELRLVNPDVGAAWDSLKPTVQRRYMAAMAQNAKGEPTSWTEESLRGYQQLKGMAHDNPVEFLAHDVISDKLPNSAKRELINLQQRLKTQSDADPRVNRAMSILTPDLRAAGIDKATDKDSYYQFIGSLQDQLDQFQKDHKKTPSMDEVRSIGAQLMQAQATGRSRFLGMGTEKVPAFQMPVPDEERERLRNDPYWGAHNIQPNDQMIDRIYRAQKFKELYGGSAKKPAEAQFPPNG